MRAPPYKNEKEATKKPKAHIQNDFYQLLKVKKKVRREKVRMIAYSIFYICIFYNVSD